MEVHKGMRLQQVQQTISTMQHILPVQPLLRSSQLSRYSLPFPPFTITHHYGNQQQHIIHKAIRPLSNSLEPVITSPGLTPDYTARLTMSKMQHKRNGESVLHPDSNPPSYYTKLQPKNQSCDHLLEKLSCPHPPQRSPHISSPPPSITNNRPMPSCPFSPRNQECSSKPPAPSVVKHTATTYQSNQQRTKPNQKGKKIKCKVPIITKSCCAQPQSASTMNAELQTKVGEPKRRS